MPSIEASSAFLSSPHVWTSKSRFISDSCIPETLRRPCSATRATRVFYPISSYQTGKIKTNIRVFLDQSFVPGQTVALNSSEIRHLRARRARNGDVLLLLNDQGSTATALLQQSEAVILQVSPTQPSTPSIVAFIGIPKTSSRTDWIVEKLTELGVSAITFTITARTSVRPSDAKLQRWRRLAVAATKQCLRAQVPKITVCSFDFVLKEVQRHQAPLVFCSGGYPLLSDRCIAPVKHSSSALLLIGPEGGFDDTEIDNLVRAGATKVGLGDSRLRIETSAIVAVGTIGQILLHTPSSDPKNPE